MGDFVRHLSAVLAEKSVGLPFESERPWHEVFFELATTEGPGRHDPSTRFLDRMRFDADGRYPKCRRLSDYLQTLHWLGAVSVSNPSYRIATVPQNLLRIWIGEARGMPHAYQELLDRAAERFRNEIEASNESEDVD